MHIYLLGVNYEAGNLEDHRYGSRNIRRKSHDLRYAADITLLADSKDLLKLIKKER